MLIISERLKYLRARLEKSQQEMSELLEVPRSSYAKWELGTSVPDIEALINVGKKLNIDWTSLVKETIVGEPLAPELSETDLLDIYAKEILKLSERIRKKNAKSK